MSYKVQVYKNSGESKVKAGVSVVVDDAIVIKGIKIIEGPNGLFVSMPSKPKMENGAQAVDENGKAVYLDIVHPISAEARKVLVDAIMEEYNKQ